MLDAGCRLKSFYAPEDDLAAAYAKAFPDAKRVPDEREILEDPEIKLVVGAGILADRAPMAVRAMRHGKDVMLDKPGATTLEQLAELRRVQAETGRILSILYSEHYTQPATVAAGELVKEGAIGRVLQTIGLGPHRIGNYARPDWFWKPRAHRRHPLRHRLASGRAVPVLHRQRRARRSWRARSPISIIRTTPEFEDFGADAARVRPRDGLHPRRLVHAGRPAGLGRRAALHPRHRGHDRAPEIHRHRRRGRAAIISSSSTARARATSIAPARRSSTASSFATMC